MESADSVKLVESVLTANFCQPVAARFLIDFCPTSVRLLSNFCPTSVRLLSNFCPTSVQLLSDFCPTFVRLISDNQFPPLLLLLPIGPRVPFKVAVYIYVLHMVGQIGGPCFRATCQSTALHCTALHCTAGSIWSDWYHALFEGDN
jgi:hypothetical protein